MNFLHQWRQGPDTIRLRNRINPSVRQKIDTAIRMGLPLWPLSFVGPAGVGKTCTALCVFDWWRQMHAGDCWYCTISQLTEVITDAKMLRLWLEGDRVATTIHDVWDMYCRCSLVVIDELGMRGTVSDAAYEALKGALDFREGKPLLLISNLTLGEITRVYDDRIASRMGAGTVLEMSGDDRRIAGEVAS